MMGDEDGWEVLKNWEDDVGELDSSVRNGGGQHYEYSVQVHEIWELSGEHCWQVRENREEAENCTFLGHYAASSGNFLPRCCPETSVRNYHYSLRR